MRKKAPRQHALRKEDSSPTLPFSVNTELTEGLSLTSCSPAAAYVCGNTVDGSEMWPESVPVLLEMH